MITWSRSISACRPRGFRRVCSWQIELVRDTSQGMNNQGAGTCRAGQEDVFSIWWDVPPVREYDARIDVKKRVTLREARYHHYHVQEYSDGRIVLEPRVLAAPFEVSRTTLEQRSKWTRA